MRLIALTTIYTEVGGEPVPPGKSFEISSKEQAERLIQNGAAKAAPVPESKPTPAASKKKSKKSAASSDDSE